MATLTTHSYQILDWSLFESSACLTGTTSQLVLPGQQEWWAKLNCLYSQREIVDAQLLSNSCAKQNYRVN
jgi:hypothetical protein